MAGTTLVGQTRWGLELGLLLVDDRMRARLKAEGVSRRQTEVLQLICDGHGNRAIGQMLHVEQGTVKFHIGQLNKHLGCSRRTQLVCWVVRRHLGLV